MQVPCSICGARYAVDPVAIGPAGRTVQCARCSHRWFEPPQASPVALPDSAAPEARAPEPPVPDVVIRPQTPGAGLPALTSPPPTRRWTRWLAAAAILVVVAGSLSYLWRDQIRARLPAGWISILALENSRGSTAAGRTTPSAQASQARIEIDFDSSKIEWIDGRYVVQGELVNTGRAPGSSSRLRLIFRKNNDVLGERTYPLSKGPIGPGARVSFTQPLDEPPPGTTDLVPAVE